MGAVSLTPSRRFATMDTCYILPPRTQPLCRYDGVYLHKDLFPEGRYISILYLLGGLGDTDPLGIEAVGHL